MQHAVDERWISRGGRGATDNGLSILPRSNEATKVTKRRLWRSGGWRLTWRRFGGYVGEGFVLVGGTIHSFLPSQRRVTTKGARGAKAEKPRRAIPVFFVLLVLFVAIALRLVWRVGHGLNSKRRQQGKFNKLKPWGFHHGVARSNTEQDRMQTGLGKRRAIAFRPRVRNQSLLLNFHASTATQPWAPHRSLDGDGEDVG